MLKNVILYLALSAIFAAIGWLFYSQEVQYWLPTPIPTNYTEVPLGTRIEFPYGNDSRKTFIHFYNPECPCSKFNLTTYKNLVKSYGSDFSCYAVVQESLKGVPESQKELFESLGVNLIVDKGKKLAKKTGVYSTPQIVILDEDGYLYYRGNYNQSRYCTNPATNFAQVALDSAITNKNYFLPTEAFTAYGCVLERETH